MHWGTFRLTDEPLGEPPLRLAAELANQGIPATSFVAGSIGESWLATAANARQPMGHPATPVRRAP
jgi:N-acyl-phosphatidylethanolamine-hydrolysing phospholipase D